MKYKHLDIQQITKEEIISRLRIACDGVGDMIEPISNCSTIEMGLIKIEYNEGDNILTLHLRRPGSLIGKGGSNIKLVEEYIGCKIHIIEVRNLSDLLV